MPLHKDERSCLTVCHSQVAAAVADELHMIHECPVLQLVA